MSWWIITKSKIPSMSVCVISLKTFSGKIFDRKVWGDGFCFWAEAEAEVGLGGVQPSRGKEEYFIHGSWSWTRPRSPDYPVRKAPWNDIRRMSGKSNNLTPRVQIFVRFTSWLASMKCRIYLSGKPKKSTWELCISFFIGFRKCVSPTLPHCTLRTHLLLFLSIA